MTTLGIILAILFPIGLILWSCLAIAKRADQLDEECLRRVRRRR